MKWIKYQIVQSTVGEETILVNKKVGYSDENLAIAQKEAYNGYEIIDDEQSFEKEPLAIEFGGTGAKTAEQARENIGAAPAGVEVVSKKGTVVSANNSDDAPLLGLKLFGKTTQFTTTGKNLYKTTAEAAVYNADGTITITNSGNYDTSGPSMNLAGKIPAGTYTFSVPSIYGFVYYKRASDDYSTQITSGGKKTFEYDGESFLTFNFSNVPANTTATYKIQLERGATATEFEPYTGGIPAPNPDYPQELVSAGASGTIKTKVSGGNIFDPTKLASWNTTCEISEDEYTITMEGKEAYARATYVEKFWLAGQTLYFEMDSATSSNANVIPMAQIEITCPSTSSRISIDPNNPKAVVSIPTDAEDVHIKLYANQTSTTLSENVKIIYKGVRFTFAEGAKWEPYKAPQTITASTPNGLPAIPVSSGGNYTDENGQQWICDEIDFARGVYVQRVGQATVTDANRWDKSTVTYVDRYLTMLDESGATQYPHNGFCNVCKIEKMSSQVGLGFFDVYQNWTRIAVNFAEYGTTTADDFKAAIPAGGIKCAWVLAEPKYTALSAEELAAYAALYTNKPNTTVYNDAGAEMEVSYCTPNTAVPMNIGTGAKGKVLTVDECGHVVPKKISAGDVDARPNSWTPTAEQVGARPNTWLPTIAEIGAAPGGYGYGEGLVGLGNANDDAAFTDALSKQFALTANKTRQFYFTYGGGAYLGKLWNAGNNYGVLVATSYAEPNVGYRFKQMVRVCTNGTWGAWVDNSPTSFAPAEFINHAFASNGLCSNFLLVDTANQYGTGNVPQRVSVSDVTTLTNVPTGNGFPTSGAFIGHRTVDWYENNRCVVTIHEAYPSPGRTWVNHYNVSAWSGWKCINTADNPTVLVENVHYGAELPAAGTKGRLFFKVVQ